MPNTLLPEQTKAMDYLRRHGTESPLADLRRRVEETFRDLAALLQEIPEASVRVRPRPGLRAANPAQYAG
jgi:hypothetical protein